MCWNLDCLRMSRKESHIYTNLNTENIIAQNSPWCCAQKKAGCSFILLSNQCSIECCDGFSVFGVLKKCESSLSILNGEMLSRWKTWTYFLDRITNIAFCSPYSHTTTRCMTKLFSVLAIQQKAQRIVVDLNGTLAWIYVNGMDKTRRREHNINTINVLCWVSCK